MNVIFNELRQQRVKYVHTTSKIIIDTRYFSSHIIFIANLCYFNWNYFVMRSNAIRRAWVDLLSKVKVAMHCCEQKPREILFAVMSVYIIKKFICTLLCSAYTILLQKVTRYACDYRTFVLNTTESRYRLSMKVQWMDIPYRACKLFNIRLQCVSKETSPTFLAVTRESIVGFS